jgi:hypothetical protein
VREELKRVLHRDRQWPHREVILLLPSTRLHQSEHGKIPMKLSIAELARGWTNLYAMEFLQNNQFRPNNCRARLMQIRQRGERGQV